MLTHPCMCDSFIAFISRNELNSTCIPSQLYNYFLCKMLIMCNINKVKVIYISYPKRKCHRIKHYNILLKEVKFKSKSFF